MEYRNITDGQTNLLSLSRVSILTRDKKQWQATIKSYLRKSWWANASRPCGYETWPKVETETFLRDVIIMMNKDVYIKQMSGT